MGRIQVVPQPETEIFFASDLFAFATGETPEIRVEKPTKSSDRERETLSA